MGICGLKWQNNSLIIDLLKQLEKTSFPQFESFIIEEEEGSGKQLPLLIYLSSRFLFSLISVGTSDVNLFRWLRNCLQGSEKKRWETDSYQM